MVSKYCQLVMIFLDWDLTKVELKSIKDYIVTVQFRSENNKYLVQFEIAFVSRNRQANQYV